MIEGYHAQLGFAAGVATSLLWTVTALSFTAAGKRMGATPVNTFRIFVAIALLCLTHRLLAGTWWPDVLPSQVLLLGLSGIVGLSIGDQALFVSFVDIGPRLSMLIMTTSPLCAAFLGWAVLGEQLAGASWIGIALTVAGVAWVVAERPTGADDAHRARRARGVALAFVGAACQAGGLLLSKQGMGHGWLPQQQHLAPQAATMIRMIFAGLGVIPIYIIYRARLSRRREQQGVESNRPLRRSVLLAGLGFAVLGAVGGPFLGVWMSLVATDRAPLGVAQTLCSLSPIFLLPAVAVIHKERVTARATCGAIIAVAGAALLFVRPS